jgi:hypothetical protein
LADRKFVLRHLDHPKAPGGLALKRKPIAAALRAQAVTSGFSPLRSGPAPELSSDSGELGKEQARVFDIGGVEPFGEPAMYRREEGAGFNASPELNPEPGMGVTRSEVLIDHAT